MRTLAFVLLLKALWAFDRARLLLRMARNPGLEGLSRQEGWLVTAMVR